MDATALLLAYGQGDHKALDALLPLVYEQLKELAHRRLRRERADHTFETTGLVHEAYLKMININQSQWQNRNQFFADASQMMRQVLIDYARQKKALKRGGDQVRVSFEVALHKPDEYPEQLIDLDEALRELEKINPRQAQIIAYRYFGDFSIKETADLLNVSAETVYRDHRFARAWLNHILSESE